MLYKFDYGPAGAVPRPSEQITATTTTPAQMRQYAAAFRQNVVFGCLSVEGKEAKGQQGLADEQLTSPNSALFLSPANTVATACQVSAFSTYWLTGHDGRITQAHAPRYFPIVAAG